MSLAVYLLVSMTENGQSSGVYSSTVGGSIIDEPETGPPPIV